MSVARGAATSLGLVLLLHACGASAGTGVEFGALEVTSEVPARVYIEGFLLGRTPVSILHLEPGAYRMVLSREGADDLVQDIGIHAGEITVIDSAQLADSNRGRSYVRDEDDWIPLLDEHKARYERATTSKRLREFETLEIGNFLLKSDEPIPLDHLYTLLPLLAARDRHGGRQDAGLLLVSTGR